MKAEDLVGLFQGGLGNGVVFVQLAAHTDDLRTLTGEEKSEFQCSVHREFDGT